MNKQQKMTKVYSVVVTHCSGGVLIWYQVDNNSFPSRPFAIHHGAVSQAASARQQHWDTLQLVCLVIVSIFLRLPVTIGPGVRCCRHQP